jgi:hypothetical protein
MEDRSEAKKYLRANSNKEIAVQNGAYDIRQLRACGAITEQWTPRLWDTMVVEQALFGGYYQKFGLQDLARRWLHKRVPKELGNSFSNTENMTPEMRAYATTDAILTYRVADLQQQYVNTELDGDFQAYYMIDLPALWAILDMQPIRIDVDAWIEYSDDMLTWTLG